MRAIAGKKSLLSLCLAVSFSLWICGGFGSSETLNSAGEPTASSYLGRGSGSFISLDNEERESRGEIQIPFDLVLNKIILPVKLNDSRELKIILDTGMPSPGLLLFDSRLAEELNLTGAGNFRILGAGDGQVSYALKAESAKLSLGSVDFYDQNVLILQNDIMRSMTSDGVIGLTLFDSHVVSIDYDNNIVVPIDPELFVPDPSWEEIDLFFMERRIPFVQVTVSMTGEEDIDLSVYIDLASSEALEMMVKPGMKFALPKDLKSKYLGKGLDGHIVGQYGRVSRLKIGSFVLHDVPAVFPKSDIRSRQPEADGILCNDVIRRFNVIFDYGRQRMYIRPNRSFDEHFEEQKGSKGRVP